MPGPSLSACRSLKTRSEMGIKYSNYSTYYENKYIEADGDEDTLSKVTKRETGKASV